MTKWNKLIFAISIISCLFLIALPVFSAEIRSESFTDEQIEQMNAVQAEIQTTFGNITLKFFPDLAPNHVNNFIELAKSGFYDGTTFHRVIPDFMIQGGDPNSRSSDRTTHGTGGPGYSLKAEFSDRDHKRGILSMARSTDPDSAGSQFFICISDSPHLNGNYTVFGEVINGMDVADKIVSQERDENNNPLEKIEMTVKIQDSDTTDNTDDNGGGGSSGCFIKCLD